MKALTALTHVVFIVAMILLVGFTLTNGSHAGSEAVYSQAEVRQFIADAADCHAEFFYTHDPQITGVGIPDALRACDPFKEGR